MQKQPQLYLKSQKIEFEFNLEMLLYATAQKMKFSIKDFFSKADLVTFTEEILNAKLHFLCSLQYLQVSYQSYISLRVVADDVL